MAVLPILKYPDPILLQEAEAINQIDDDIKTLAEDMVETMIDAPGAGLAAPQVGRSCRMIVVHNIDTEDIPYPMVLINPEIVIADGQQVYNEGCLSVEDLQADVVRAMDVRVKALDLDGRPLEIDASGHMAVVYQHEIDHLEGILFIDRISRLKRDMYKRKIRKQMKKKQEEDS